MIVLGIAGGGEGGAIAWGGGGGGGGGARPPGPPPPLRPPMPTASENQIAVGRSRHFTVVILIIILRVCISTCDGAWHMRGAI